jgi:hypothetical protein
MEVACPVRDFIDFDSYFDMENARNYDANIILVHLGRSLLPVGCYA